MKILLTGANGQLGQCFQDRVPDDWDVWATDTSELDITNNKKVLKAVETFKPDIIVNAAAYTAVDKAETEIDIAKSVNEDGPRNLAIAANRYGAILFHISTDYVFDGSSTTPYLENDLTNPLGIYGKTKLDGEKAVITNSPTAIIIRTAWVFSEYGGNFVKTMLRLGREKKELSIINDQRGCPTYAGDIAQAIIEMIKIKTSCGIYHFCGDKEVSWYEFAEHIFKKAVDANIISRLPSLNAITTDAYPTAAKRPSYSSLNCTKMKVIGINPSNWRYALENVLAKL
ncbi:dTDP-4-dehydrorhamnose reductase [Klebsiella michiganensis]|uniref:dTDP-4-dehydrorhamnose reductase n=1 Tax=Klebsiella michiganensis TaxID=1134687 RepID=UPI0015E539BB|nr:dTDP-4-dehydrorhamnose reductase [Klebsiella michiganensis]MBA8306011.1 dTDP-4-dehydrorhamnose reductase [Klebsiella michiganensis]MDH1342345.1 dTDP-4-dehydrorhamnose reductase [Klebsiella michiganensis]QLP35586.1 dTDP-4-dehydrorhamnose reductase [Klebsiella michiganensis]WFX49226.1 dTDP-4-dehydrorhamnose reductase [Klebsiella michiganensis]WFX54886.1 dTDP-4-dehydrorhamnose reductase [Klebsiella michiganensis]